MTPYWIEPQNVCIEAENKEVATKIAIELTLTSPTSVRELPYPGGNRIGPMSDCPSFCYSPEACAGRDSCPRGYACSE